MRAVSIREFRSDEWRLYRRLRLRALLDSPDAFSSTHDETASRPEDHWRSRLAGRDPRLDLALLAEVNDDPAGICWGRIEPDATRTANVYQMWVAPEYRRSGAGRRMLEAVVAWATERGVSSVCLDVMIGNEPAQRLYEAVGFRPDGDPAPMRPGSALEEQPMRLTIAPPTAPRGTE